MESSKERLFSSKALYELEQYNVSVSLSYYSMFLAAKALIISRGYETKKHSGVISIFGNEFVNKGNFNKEIFKYLTSAQSLREDSDYNAVKYITQEIAEEQILHAEEFIAEAEMFI